ncbi:MAG: hypothetical protein HZA89_13480, partial [Verrucomicrobia bacterium]|nr:hypothetical protein [Verrucomicrobiota bacterium]
WLQGTWAARFNRFRGEAGRPFQGRYKALHVEPGHALAQVAHYIHLNPVRAKVVPIAKVADFAWSSLPLFLSRDRPAALEGGTVLRESGDLSDTRAGWLAYVAYLGVIAEEETKLRDKRFGRLSRGWVIGSVEFKAELKKELSANGAAGGRLELLGADSAAHAELRSELWEERLQSGARLLDVDLNALPVQKSAPGKVQLAALLKATTSVSNGWVAQRLQMGEPASVSQFVRRFHLSGGANTRAFKAVLSNVTT